LVAVAWMAIRYCSLVGTGSGREVIRRSFGPWGGLLLEGYLLGEVVFGRERDEEDGAYLDVFFDLDSTHLEW